MVAVSQDGSRTWCLADGGRVLLVARRMPAEYKVLNAPGRDKAGNVRYGHNGRSQVHDVTQARD